MDFQASVARSIDGTPIAYPEIPVTESASNIAMCLQDDLVIPNGASDLEVSLADVEKDEVKFFILTMSAYHADLSVKFASAGGTPVVLTGPIILSSIAAQWLPDHPNKLFFTNAGTEVTGRAEMAYDPTP